MVLPQTPTSVLWFVNEKVYSLYPSPMFPFLCLHCFQHSLTARQPHSKLWRLHRLHSWLVPRFETTPRNGAKLHDQKGNMTTTSIVFNTNHEAITRNDHSGTTHLLVGEILSTLNWVSHQCLLFALALAPNALIHHQSGSIIPACCGPHHCVPYQFYLLHGHKTERIAGSAWDLISVSSGIVSFNARRCRQLQF